MAWKPSWLQTGKAPFKQETTGPKTDDQTDQAERKRFYRSKEWLQLRAVKLSLNPLCQACEARAEANGMPGIGVSLATVVHHVKPLSTHPELGLDLDNLESSCLRCHNRSHPEKGSGRK